MNYRTLAVIGLIWGALLSPLQVLSNLHVSPQNKIIILTMDATLIVLFSFSLSLLKEMEDA